MTFPFSGEFKFKLLKAKREDDMTSSTIKNLNGDICIEFFCISIRFLRARNAGKFFRLLFCISIAREMSGENSLARKRESGGK